MNVVTYSLAWFSTLKPIVCGSDMLTFSEGVKHASICKLGTPRFFLPLLLAQLSHLACLYVFICCVCVCLYVVCVCLYVVCVCLYVVCTCVLFICILYMYLCVACICTYVVMHAWVWVYCTCMCFVCLHLPNYLNEKIADLKICFELLLNS